MLTIQYGQCGNQLGHELFTKITSDIESRNSGQSYEANYDYSEASCDRWFSGITKDGKRIARAIIVDTERKVVEKLRAKEITNCEWRYSRKNEICQINGEGSGNNWSYGYMVKAKELESDIAEAVRRECERTDRLDGFVKLLGSAGGTGSGVGSRMLEIFRDEYPTKTILGILIVPFANGEVATQNYNGLLTLAKFQDFSDAIILLENDQLFRICTISSAERHQRINAEPKFLRDMNEVACEKLLAVFQPIDGVRNGANFFANKMAAHPSYKIATIKCTLPERFSTKHEGYGSNVCETGSLKWLFHVRQLRNTLRIAGGSNTNFEVMSDVARSKMASTARAGISESNYHAYRRSIANILITRGCSRKLTNRNALCKKDDDDPTLSSEQLTDDRLYASWSLEEQRFTHIHEKRRFLEREKFVALVTNNSQIRESLDGIVQRAWNCYTHAAFLHGYKQFGLEEDDFLRAFAKMENVIKLYGELDKS